ncbi:CU044_5270 family protein [Nonomuraea sp. NN258]|uniref:CU044_5270 family protein n=1 Tax=Nonomuraea antri TaxID=2730852 RepID=UPI001569AE58|nr:CU044_5270 family protein [Nonomuraea antri]NRQ39311.1 CU044_5270 family protein [Nonomuraea antri]
MDDLRQIRDLFGSPQPSPHAQARVWQRVRAGRRRRRLTWPAALLAVAAAVTVAALFLRPAAPVDGRSILLAAATTAATSGTGAEGGTYWHIKKVHDGTRVTELWATRDGRAWTGERGRIVQVKGGSPYSMGGRELTYQQIAALPADAAALRQRVSAMLPPGSPALLADALAGLLWSKPSPPGVRAAAYRALADLPEVRYLGEGADARGRSGEVFAFALTGGGRRTLIVDPDTSQVLSATDDGGRSQVVLEAGWTDQGPGLR